MRGKGARLDIFYWRRDIGDLAPQRQIRNRNLIVRLDIGGKMLKAIALAVGTLAIALSTTADDRANPVGVDN